ncbi:hypothetical protein AMS68_000364 [Peltaster fructicola]|uniref:Iron-sulfur cluster assembly factor IBA57 homolog, mitochondrial n=1 Tax=Peltaster fructicola TaxID=286661 RepID=A0A6H0XJE2_9PEZI|nr:hypothetical protein AMS68_000364 [Peltaster fructicola]
MSFTLSQRSICTRCLHSTQRHRKVRQLSTQSIPPSPPPPPPATGAAKLSNRRLVSLHGPDAPKFLQGIITNSVSVDRTAGNGFFAAFLTAQGKVLNDVFIYPTIGSRWQKDHHDDGDQGFLVEVDSEQAELLFKHLKRHKLRSKFKLRQLEVEELDVWSVWREDDRWTQHTHARSNNEILSLQDCRAPGMGQRLLLPPTTSSPELDGVQEAPLAAYTIRRYLRGIAEGQSEIPREESLPMNYNFDLMGGIDFKKGCYIGQELTIRTHHTGVVRRRVLPVSLYDAASQPPTEPIYDPQSTAHAAEGNTDIKKASSKKRATGKLIASVGNVGLALCRLEQMSDLVVTSEGNSFDPAEKFVVEAQDGQVTGIQPFVPDWVRGRIREPRVQRRVE